MGGDSIRWPTSGSICVAMRVTTTTAAFTQHCATSRQLTMSAEPRRYDLSTKSREDPARQRARVRREVGVRRAPLMRSARRWLGTAVLNLVGAWEWGEW